MELPTAACGIAVVHCSCHTYECPCTGSGTPVAAVLNSRFDNPVRNRRKVALHSSRQALPSAFRSLTWNRVVEHDIFHSFLEAVLPLETFVERSWYIFLPATGF